MELPEALRDLARRVDVRVPILPPPPLAPALQAAADEIGRLNAKVAGHKAAVDAIATHAAERRAEVDRLVAAATARQKDAGDAVKRAADAEATLKHMETEMRDRLARINAVMAAGMQSADALAEMQRDAAVMLAECESVAELLDAAQAMLMQLRPFMDAAATLRDKLRG